MLVNVKDIVVEAKLKSSLRKIQLFLLKFIPIVISILYLLNAILYYFDIRSDIPSALGGVSLLIWLYLYIGSWVNGFCAYHRMFLYYIAIEECLAWYDYEIGIPVSDKTLFVTNILIAGITILLVVYLKFKVCVKH